MTISPAAKRLTKRLSALAFDLGWTWCPLARRTFAAIDPQQWEACKHAPLELLRRTSAARLEACAGDSELLGLLASAEGERQARLSAKTWFERTHQRKTTKHDKDAKLRVAYFCSEFAIHESLPQYSGGLGVLAGDHLKSASDLGVPLVGVGLLYRHGYYIQELRSDGSTRVLYPEYDFDELPLVDTGKLIECPLGTQTVRAKVWRMQVGRVPVYLLDADVDGAPKSHRELTQGLYKGAPDLRLRQQVLLGVGGMLALDAVGEQPTVVHLNEGHAAFANMERLRRRVRAGSTLEEALEEIARSSVFTTHTPVPAGHDRYEAKQVGKYLKPLIADLGLNVQSFADLGRERPGDRDETVCMTVLGLRTATHVNGVSQLHGRVSREMWPAVYGASSPDEVPIGAITNGVHVRTWLAPEAEELYTKRLKPKWHTMGPKDNPWARAENISDEELWALRGTLRARLVHFLRGRLAHQAMRRGASSAEVAAAWTVFDEDSLTLAFARRFATYKRAPLIFREAKRLQRVLGHKQRPVQLLFAGKAHPNDGDGQGFAQEIHGWAKSSGFAGRVALLEEYDMQVGRMLTSGADVWLNNPIRPHEASGTSGMKPPLHGGLNASILDGWWPEGFDGENGWAIGDERETRDPERRDARDARDLLRVIEKEIVPAFYERTARGLPKRWVSLMRHSLASVPPQFNTHRMVGDYVAQAYLPAHRS
jgi:glycogen phosphorylase